MTTNSMKYWKENRSIYDINDRQITLKDEDRVLNISVEGEIIQFTEGCDEWFTTSYTRQEAIEVLEEAIQWIKSK